MHQNEIDLIKGRVTEEDLYNKKVKGESSMSFLKTDKIKVHSSAPHHAGRIGYFEFLADSGETVVLREEKDPESDPKTFFTIAPEYAYLEVASVPPHRITK